MSLSAFIDEQRKINCELRCRIDKLEEDLRKAHAAILEMAKHIDPEAFNEEAETPPTPAEAATDAPMEETEEKSEV